MNRPHSPSAKQAAPFLIFAILALLISAHAGCVGGALEENPGGGSPQKPDGKDPNGDGGGDDGDEYYYGGYYYG